MKRLIALLVICIALAAPSLAWVPGAMHGGASTYDGLVGTRGSVPSHLSVSTQAQARTAIFVPNGFHQIKVTIPNHYGTELAPGSAATDKVSIEYPQGTCTTLLKSGSATITAPDGGQVTTDYANLTVQGPTWIWYRLWSSNPSGIVVNAFHGQNLSLGDALILGSSVPDQTVTCDPVVDGGTFMSIAPIAVIGPTTAPSFCILGDSIALGVDNDHTPNSVGDNGIIAPSIGPSFGYSNMGVNADSASAFVSNHANRAAVLQNCSHLDVEFGTNDLELVGSSVAQLQADLTTIYGLVIPGTIVFQNALIARANCATDCSTLLDQTPVASESKRVAFNSALTSGSFGPNGGFFDPQSVVGTGTNNSLWKAGNPGFPPCVPNWTNEAVHPNTCAYLALQGSGYIDLSRMHR